MGEKRVRRTYPPEFEVEAVRLAGSIGINDAAERLGVPRATIGNWVRRRGRSARAGAGELALGGLETTAARRSASELETEVVRLRRELANTKLDNEILRKAAAYFARESR
jgi:transposase